MASKTECWQVFQKKTDDLLDIIENTTLLESYKNLAFKCPPQHRSFYVQKFFGYYSYLIMEVKLLLDGVIRIIPQSISHKQYINKNRIGTYLKQCEAGEESLQLSMCSVNGVIDNALQNTDTSKQFEDLSRQLKILQSDVYHDTCKIARNGLLKVNFNAVPKEEYLSYVVKGSNEVIKMTFVDAATLVTGGSDGLNLYSEFVSGVPKHPKGFDGIGLMGESSVVSGSNKRKSKDGDQLSSGKHKTPNKAADQMVSELSPTCVAAVLNDSPVATASPTADDSVESAGGQDSTSSASFETLLNNADVPPVPKLGSSADQQEDGDTASPTADDSVESAGGQDSTSSASVPNLGSRRRSSVLTSDSEGEDLLTPYKPQSIAKLKQQVLNGKGNLPPASSEDEEHSESQDEEERASAAAAALVKHSKSAQADRQFIVATANEQKTAKKKRAKRTTSVDMEYIPLRSVDLTLSLLHQQDPQQDLDWNSFVVSDEALATAKSAKVSDCMWFPAAATRPRATERLSQEKGERKPRCISNQTTFDLALYDADDHDDDEEAHELTPAEIATQVNVIIRDFGDFLVDVLRVEVARSLYFERKCVELVCSLRSVMKVENDEYLMIPWVYIVGVISDEMRTSFRGEVLRVLNTWHYKQLKLQHEKLEGRAPSEVQTAEFAAKVKRFAKSMNAYQRTHIRKVNNCSSSVANKLVVHCLQANESCRVAVKPKMPLGSEFASVFQAHALTGVATKVIGGAYLEDIADQLRIPNATASQLNAVETTTESVMMKVAKSLSIEYDVNDLPPGGRDCGSILPPSIDLLCTMVNCCKTGDSFMDDLITVCKTKNPLTMFPRNPAELNNYMNKVQQAQLEASKKPSVDGSSGSTKVKKPRSSSTLPVAASATSSNPPSVVPSASITVLNDSASGQSIFTFVGSSNLPCASQAAVNILCPFATPVSAPTKISPAAESTSSGKIADVSRVNSGSGVEILEKTPTTRVLSNYESEKYIAMSHRLKKLFLVLIQSISAFEGRFGLDLGKSCLVEGHATSMLLALFKLDTTLPESVRKVADGLPALLFVSYKDDDYYNTPANGFCYYNATYQLRCNEKSGYATTLSSLKTLTGSIYNNPETKTAFRDHLQFTHAQIQCKGSEYLEAEYKQKVKIALDFFDKHHLPDDFLESSGWGSLEWITRSGISASLFTADWTRLGTGRRERLLLRKPKEQFAFLASSSHLPKDFKHELTAPSLSEVRQLMGLVAPPNFAVHKADHFFVIDNPSAMEASHSFGVMEMNIMSQIMVRIASIADRSGIESIVHDHLEMREPANVAFDTVDKAISDALGCKSRDEVLAMFLDDTQLHAVVEDVRIKDAKIAKLRFERSKMRAKIVALEAQVSNLKLLNSADSSGLSNCTADESNGSEKTNLTQNSDRQSPSTSQTV